MPVAFRNVMSVLAVILTGMLAGLQWGTGMAQYTALSLPGPVWLLRHQAEDALFRRVMPGYMWAVLLSLLAAAVLTKGRVRVLFVIAAILSACNMFVTITGEVPINRMVAQWTPATMPADWDAIRHHWIAGHVWRSLFSFLAFLLAATGLLRSDTVASRR
jgi:hypothetical protein